MPKISLKEVPKFIRARIKVPADLPQKRELNAALTSLIEDFFSDFTLNFNEEEVRTSYSDIPEWRIDTVLAKLRSLLEQKAKKELRIFCAKLDKKQRDQVNQLLRRAGLYSFRDSIDLDLYVGVHTAISAYFKMMGVALVATTNCNPPISIHQSSRELFRVLRFVATLPLKYLMALDGLFWDSKQYQIPKSISSEITGSEVYYFIDAEELEKRLLLVIPDEEHTGCPALRSKTNLGTSVFELVENCCVECLEKYFLNFDNKS